MTQDEIIRMATAAGFNVTSERATKGFCGFAALVAAHEREKAKGVFEELEREVKAELINAINCAVEIEREACAKVCELIGQGGIGDIGDDTTELCAAAIRLRSEK